MNSDPSPSSQGRIADPGFAVRTTLATIGTLALLALLFRLPTRLIPFSTCGFKNLTGFDCPGCGMTRGLTALLQGDLATALAFHPLSPVFLGIMVTITAWAWYDLSQGSSTLERMFERWGIIGGISLVVFLVLTWAVRIGRS